MRLSTMLALAFCTAILAPTASAQGIYTERGFGAELGYQSGDHASDVNVGIGYTANRLFEAGLSLARESYDGSDGNRTYITPRVRGYFVRQGDDIPVTAWGEAHYHFVSISDAPDDYSESGWGIGIGAAGSFAASALAITPMVGLAYTGYTASYGDEDFTVNPFLINLAVYASGSVGPGTLYGGPVLVMETGDDVDSTQFGFRIGMVVSK